MNNATIGLSGSLEPSSYTQTPQVIVVWLIFASTLCLIMLKAIKYVCKWRNKKITTADAIDHLNVLVGDMMQQLSANRGQAILAAATV